MRELILFTLLTLTFFGRAQNEITLVDKAHRLTTYLSDVHVRPRKMDSTFGKDVNALLIDDFDPRHLIFSSKDADLLQELSLSLGSEISEKSSTYSTTFSKLYAERREIAEKTLQSLIAQPMDLEKYARAAIDDIEGFAKNDTEFTQRWERMIIKSIIEELLDLYDDEHDLSAADLLLKKKEAIENVRVSYQHYFEALKTNDRYFDLRFLNCVTLAYDPHSSYFDLTLKDEYKDELVADRAIFGISYQRTLSGKTEISGVVPGSSAWFSGEVHVGDEIIAISATDGREVTIDSLGIDGLRTFFTQLQSDTISLELSSEDEEIKTVQLVRSRVYSDGDVIKTAVLSGDKKIGYISLPDFYTNWTNAGDNGCANDVAKSLLNLQKEHVEGFVLDLRDNGGGSLKEAVDLVGIFINYGPVIVEEIANGELFSYKDMNRGSITSAPLIVLINAQSASASEVVAGALQDYNRALIVGQTSFGKATGQNIFPLDPAVDVLRTNQQKENEEWGYAKATRMGLYRITKQSAQAKGIVPDIELLNIETFPSDYERELPHSIQLDSVEKNVYATIGAPLPIERLKAMYSPSSISVRLSELRDSILTIENQLNASLSLEKSVKLLQLVHTLYDAHGTIFDEAKTLYTPVSKQFNAAQLLVAPYLEKYDHQFTTRLLHDIELNEAYQIMLNFIGIHQ